MEVMVIVHGIGSPPEGSHLRSYVRQWHQMATDRGVATTVENVQRKRTDTGPPIATLNINGDKTLVAEASWKDLVPEPTFVEVALWLATVTPFTMIDLLRSSARRFRDAKTESHWVAIAMSAEIVLLRLLIGVLLFPLWFAPLLIAIAFSALLPGEIGKATLGVIRDRLSGVLGDSYLFVADPIVRESVIERVKIDIETLLERCEHATVIGHSQGGHIALSATARLTPEQRSRVELATWGSGIRRLRQLERVMADEPISSVRAAAPVLGLPTIAAMIVWTDGGWTLIAFGLIAIALSLWWLVRIGNDYELSTEDINTYAGSAPKIWTDFWATRDLIPDGALPTTAISSQPIVNRRSMIKDHSTYISNPHLMLQTLATRSEPIRESLTAQPLPEPVEGKWWPAWRALVATALICGVWSYLAGGAIGLTATLLLAAPIVVWCRFELHWRLRRRRQARPTPAGPFANWVGDAHDAKGYQWLTATLSGAILLATLLGTEAPATISQNTPIGISRGFGNLQAAMSSIGVLAAAALLITCRRALRNYRTTRAGEQQRRVD